MGSKVFLKPWTFIEKLGKNIFIGFQKAQRILNNFSLEDAEIKTFLWTLSLDSFLSKKRSRISSRQDRAQWNKFLL